MRSTRKYILFLFTTALALSSHLEAQDRLTHAYGRETFSLNGQWQYIIDPYETGFYNYRFPEKSEKDPEAYWNRGASPTHFSMTLPEVALWSDQKAFAFEIHIFDGTGFY